IGIRLQERDEILTLFYHNFLSYRPCLRIVIHLNHLHVQAIVLANEFREVMLSYFRQVRKIMHRRISRLEFYRTPRSAAAGADKIFPLDSQMLIGMAMSGDK